MVVLQLGVTLHRLSGGEAAPNKPFEEFFDIERPTLEVLDLESLKALGPQLCILRFKPNGIKIRAEFLPATCGGVLMLGSPAVSKTSELAELGLTLDDFTAHESTADFLMALTTHRATLDDLRRLTLVLEAQKKDLKQANAMLADATAEARRASESKSRFLSKISHEIRTPLHAIAGFSKLLLDKVEPSDRDSFIDAIHESSELLVALVGQVLDLAKIEADRIEIVSSAFDPRALFNRVVNLYTSPAKAKMLDLDCRIEMPDNVWLEGDPLRIEQIAMNLVGNAVKFTAHGSITILASWKDSLLRVEVKDTGPGISQTDLARIFQPFTQVGPLDGRGDGSGLGLTISRELAALMGGSITVLSDGVSGCLFRLEIPAPLTVPPLRDPARPPLAPTPRKILIVDDNELNRLLGKRLLERDGHLVQLACDGKEAIAMVSLNELDLVLMDLQMPGLDGLETMKEIRRLGSSVPVIALTASAVSADRDLCIAAGMTDYLTKPIDLAALQATLDRL